MRRRRHSSDSKEPNSLILTIWDAKLTVSTNFSFSSHIPTACLLTHPSKYISKPTHFICPTIHLVPGDLFQQPPKGSSCLLTNLGTVTSDSFSSICQIPQPVCWRSPFLVSPSARTNSVLTQWPARTSHLLTPANTLHCSHPHLLLQNRDDCFSPMFFSFLGDTLS